LLGLLLLPVIAVMKMESNIYGFIAILLALEKLLRHFSIRICDCNARQIELFDGYVAVAESSLQMLAGWLLLRFAVQNLCKFPIYISFCLPSLSLLLLLLSDENLIGNLPSTTT